jgi:DNA replication initiation complex subunit (GINS family)
VQVKSIGKELRKNLRRDKRKRIEKASVEIEKKLEERDVIGAFEILRNWYKKFTGKAVKPATVDIEETRKVYEKLFTADELLDELPFKMEYEGDAVEDGIPEEDEIKKALFRMRSRKAPGLTRISVDHMKMWYNLAFPQNSDVPPDEESLARWKTIVEIVQKCMKGEIPEAFTFGVLVIIPKDDKGGVRGIGLLESIHKLVSQIINMRLGETIQFCEEVHGFRKKRGCYTAIGEAKIRMQMAACSAKTTYQIYLDLRKAYDSIDRKRVLRILKEYGVGPNILRYIRIIWERQVFVLRQSGFYSDPLDVDRGCTQGDTDSPIIFNIIIDAVLRRWKKTE